MNDVIMAFGENAVLVAVFCGALIAAVLCALILHDNMKRRQQVARMRQEYEWNRDRHELSLSGKNKFITNEEFSRFCQQRNRQNAAISQIEQLKRPYYPNDAKNDTTRLMADGWPLS